MKAIHVGLILVSSFLFGCAGTGTSTGPKAAANAAHSNSPIPTGQPVSVSPSDVFAQDVISLETGLASAKGFYAEAPIVVVFDGSPPPQIPSEVLPDEFSRRDMSLIDDTGSQ